MRQLLFKPEHNLNKICTTGIEKITLKLTKEVVIDNYSFKDFEILKELSNNLNENNSDFIILSYEYDAIKRSIWIKVKGNFPQ